MPAPYALSLYRGDSYAYRFRFWLDAGKTQPADLTGCTARAAIRGAVGIADVPCAITLPQDVFLTIDGATWTALASGSGQWDLQLTDAAGWVTTPVAGAVYVRADVTTAAAARALVTR